MELMVDAAVVGIIVAVVQVAKPFIPESRLWPMLALVLGLAWGIGSRLSQGGDVVQGVLIGLGTGLAASGAYSQGKTAVGR
jgi:hypothetical protein